MKVVFFKSSTEAGCEDYVRLFPEAGVDYEEFVDIELRTDIDRGAFVVEKTRGADVVMSWDMPMPAEVIARLDASVRCLVKISVGYDDFDVEAACKRGILVCNVPDYGHEEVAVQAAALTLSALRQIHSYDRHVKDGEWTFFGLTVGCPARRLSRLTCATLGFGRIARNYARYMKGFGCEVWAYDPYLPDAAFAKEGVRRAATLDEVWEHADIISLHMPLTPETEKMIDAGAIAKMKKDVILVNTARGGLIDTAALIEGLESGRLRAAGLDVCDPEPIPLDSPLLRMENAVLTPHIAYRTVESYDDMQRKAVEIAIAAAKGDIPYSCVNRGQLGL